MKKNINGIDAFIRLILGITIGFLIYMNFFKDSLITNLEIALSIFLLATSLVRFCPLYSFLGVNTKKKKDRMY